LSAAPAGPLVLTHGDGSLVHTDDGRVLVDLELGFGAAFLGHNRPEVTACLRDQAGRLMSSGRHGTGRLARIQAHLDRLLPKGLQLAGVYSTGMEVAEFALRIAATQTGRREYVGFARSMHGKSTMTAALCWNNAPLQPGGLHVLPFVADAAPADILHALRALLANKRLAAVLMEPIQGSNFGQFVSPPLVTAVVGASMAWDRMLVLLLATSTIIFVAGCVIRVIERRLAVTSR
jgi:acetylornithine/succinyldiaminopimelate/putrescine aminotransferase